ATVFTVRWFTVPNGKEGKMMNPASVAATVDGEKISLGMYNLYFSSVVSQYEQYANYGYYNLDTTADYATQYTTDKDGNEISWLDFFQQETINQIKMYSAYYNAAKKDGITLTAKQQETIDTQLDGLKESASEQGKALDDYISSVFGDYCTAETVQLYMEQFYMSVNYRGKFAVETTVADDEISKYFEENKSKYYQINMSYLACEYDSSSDEAKAASEQKIKDYMSQITDRQSILDLVPTAYADYIEQDTQTAMQYDSSLTEEDARKQALESYEQNIDGVIYGSDSPFSDEINNWLFDEAQPTGTIKYYINEETGYAYIILKTEQATCVEDETYTVRHILIMPETERLDAEKDENGNTIFNEEEWAAAKTKTEEIYKQFTDGDKSEYSFALLAEEHSTDTASTSAGSGTAFGGLYEGVPLGQMVPSFEGWATDKSRQYGDTEIVESDYGYHIMFFISDRPSYQSQIVADIRNEKLDELIENAELDIHESVVKKANDKFLADKKAAQSQSAE
ncbi:MAG: peptidylprolyl isomerase, partial [Eubacterium sp.]|nr:peptidylprolyl isomerase [Eubacterium sp.]